jgi:hypothetical protein
MLKTASVPVVIGVAAAANAKPDGSTLVISGSYTVLHQRCAIRLVVRDLTHRLSRGRHRFVVNRFDGRALIPISPNTRDGPAP